MNVAGKVLAITGAASGIGRSLAVEAARRGAGLALADIDSDGIEATLEAIRAVDTGAARFTGHRLDVSNLEDWKAFGAALLDAHGTLDGVVNNAGVTFSGSVEDTPYEKLEQVMSINFTGMVYGSREFLPILKARPQALVANVSSLYGLHGMRGQSAYCASKFAIRGFTEALALELRDTPVAVASIHPGHVGTDIVLNARRRGNVVEHRLSDAQQAAFAQGFKATGLTPERAAESILDQLQRGRRRILVGPDAVRGDRWSRWFPDRFADALAAAPGR